MKLKIIEYNGTELVYDVQSFEFRSNQVANWIKVYLIDGATLLIKDVCAIKTVN